MNHSPLAELSRRRQAQRLHELNQREVRVTWIALGVLALVHVALFAYATVQELHPGSFAPGEALIFGAIWRDSVVGDRAVWRLLSCVFVHASVMHIAMNGYALYALGPLIEKFYGWRNYIIVLFASGLAGSCASVAASGAPSVGASGAIFGLMASAGVMGWKYRGRLPEAASKGLIRTTVTLFGINMLIGFTIPQIDMAAHLGGAVGGAIVTWFASADLEYEHRRSPLQGIVAWAAVALCVGAILMMGVEAAKCGVDRGTFAACYPELFTHR